MHENPVLGHLFSPLRLRNVELRNRIVSTAHGTTTSERGLPTAVTVAYHQARARGGVGLIILEAAAVHETAVSSDVFLSCHSDAVVPGIQAIVECVHESGAAVFGQLYHPGASLHGNVGGIRLVPIAPSWVIAETTRTASHAMSLGLIREMIVAFGDAASRMLKGGVDGIEINGRNGNLPAQFLNPRINARTDQYGGSFENRIRFLREIIEEVRGRIGDGVPLGLRLCAEPMDAISLEPEEVSEAAKSLTPLVDYFNIIGGSIETYAGLSHIVPPMGITSGYLAERAAALRIATRRPVLLAGRITRPEIADRLIAAGKADLCGMTRALIADPELPNKARSGRTDDIRECIGCNQACIGHEHLGAPISCIQYPETGRELTLHDQRSRAERVKRVLVAGGGPAGLKAAAVAAERGHRVTLFDRDRQFGGQARLAALVPGRSEFGGLVANLLREVSASGATLQPGVNVDWDLVRRESPDCIFVATGAAPFPAPLDGANELPTIEACEVLRSEGQIGGNVVIADERCDWVGMGVAEKLVREGSRVRICVMGDTAGAALEPMTRYRWLGILHSLGVEITPHVRIVGVSGSEVYFQHVASLQPVVFEGIETLVLAQSYRPVLDLHDVLQNYPGEIHVIGDSRAPRTAEEAVYDGLMAGLLV